MYESEASLPREICSAVDGPKLSEPGGVEWIGDDSLLICDTGNRRVLVVDHECRLQREIDLQRAWSEYYSRPQITVLSKDRWLVSDTPGSSLWLIDGEEVQKIELTGGDIVPTGLEWSDALQALVVGDLNGRIWMMEVVDD